MTLQQLNSEDEDRVRELLLRCCGSRQWAERMLMQRPFANFQTLTWTAESVWWDLEPGDWLEAFSSHPKIGDRTARGWSSQEQSGIDFESSEILKRLAEGNLAYEQRFGWIFLIAASGKSAPEILDTLGARLGNPTEEELVVAAGEQMKITRLRLGTLLGV